MLTLAELANVLDTVTYRAGWSLSVREIDPYQGPFFTILATVPNAYQPEQTVDLAIHSPIPPMPDPAAFLAWLAWRLSRVELHECLEWFQVAGKPWRDPHNLD